MEIRQFLERDAAIRLAVCGAVSVLVVCAALQLREGEDLPLWKEYGPWVKENPLQAAAVLTAVLYGVSLALWPEETEEKQTRPAGFTPCT